MKWSVLILFALCIAHGSSQDILGDLFKGASNVVRGVVGTAHNVVKDIFTGGDDGDVCKRNVLEEYRKTQKAVYSTYFKQVALHTDNHFVFSPYTIWLTLAALAEGSDPTIQPELLTKLGLPKELCARKKYYYLALNAEQKSHDVAFETKRELDLDKSVTVNPSWRDLVQEVGLLDVVSVPIKDVADSSKQPGNSMLLNYFNYHGLWTTAFPSAAISREPFYDIQGQKIGEVNMMRIKKHARLAHLPFMDAKALELPVGIDERYKMLITLGIGHDPIKNTIEIFMGAILQIFSLLQTSLVPIEIAIPRFAMTSEFDIRPMLEGISLNSFFTNPAATSYVSHPPALPNSLVQQVTVNVGPDGINPPPQETITDPLSGLYHIASNIGTGLAAAVGNDFIANKPFFFALFDTKTDTCLFAGSYSHPSTM